MEISLKNIIRKRCRVFACFSMINCIFILYMISSYITSSQDSSSIETNNRKRLNNLPMNYSQFDYYFRVEYTIIESACQPVHTFQSSETINSLEQITDQKIKEIISDNVSFNLRILRVNATLENLKRFDQNLLFLKRSDVVCNYTLELFIGMNFPFNCNLKCQSYELNRITLKMNSFDYSKDPIMTFTLSNDNPTEYFIHNIFIHQTVKFYEQTVVIKSIIDEYHFTLSTCDSNIFQPYLLMSNKSQSLFILRKGLDLSDASSIYVSFASWSRPNYYLRHENGKLKISDNDHSILFRQDATFKLIFDQQHQNVAMQAVNLANNHLLTYDSKNNVLFLGRYDKSIIITSELDRQFLFKITPYLY